MNDHKIVPQAIKELMPELEIQVRNIPLNETVITIPAHALVPVSQFLVQSLNITHLSTITGLDTGSEVIIMYHFWHGSGVTLQVHLPYTALFVVSITPFIPGALFYEREVHEMLGVNFTGQPSMQHLFLPDDWDGTPPLRQGDT